MKCLWCVIFFEVTQVKKNFLPNLKVRIISTLSCKKLLIKFAIVYLAMDQGSSSSSSINQEPQPIHKVAKKPGKGGRLTSQTKYVIENVRQFFEKKKRKGSSIKRERIVERTAEATGVSIRSVCNIDNEYISQEGKLLTLVK